MLFNSVDFAIFLPIVFILYWWAGSERRRTQNIILLAASYFFYGSWDVRFLFLIFISSLVDYTVGINLNKERKPSVRKALLWTSLCLNLGLLGFFKYYNFFIDSFRDVFSLFGKDFGGSSLDIILPVGISFYTFQTLSYTIDVYNRKMKATDDALSFFTYVAFFPQLVAGPIERAKNLLPQFDSQRIFKYAMAVDGTKQIVWGLFKKVVIADHCAIHANEIFANHASEDSISLLLGILYFLIQVYCDFSGYSDMAIGLGKLFGFRLMKNFDFPFFARNIPEFWRKWHISLTSWFVDYVYIPLGGGRQGLWIKVRNVFAIFLLSGFWHGANWTFVVWGLVCAVSFLPYLFLGINGKYEHVVAHGKVLPSLKEFFQMSGVFLFMVLSMILFRSNDIQSAYTYFIRLIDFSYGTFRFDLLTYLPMVVILIVWEWLSRTQDHGLQLESVPQKFRWIVYGMTVWAILFYFGQEQEYIYFQF